MAERQSWGHHSATTKEVRDFQRDVSRTLEAVQAQLYGLEDRYYESTPYGNVSRGWEGYADSRPRHQRVHAIAVCHVMSAA